MQFTITYWDDTENKEITQFDIKNAGNGAYTRLTFPDGVNPAKYQSVSVSGVPAGATVAGDFWAPFTDPSCNWTIPNYRWTTEAAPSFYGANVVVHLVHKTQNVTNTDPAAQEIRTAVANFVKINENGTPEAAPFDSATLDVYYIRKATKDLVTGKVTYGDWQLNTNKGSNGFQIVSGAWTLPTDSSSKITVTAPDLDGYGKADSLANGQLTTEFGTADNITSKLTTYYVPKSLTQKTINRVINLTPVNLPPAPSVTQTTTQSATITRPVRVNADDNGVVFDGFDGSGWTTGKWDRCKNIPVPDNYTKVIKQIVTHPDGTTTETTLNIPKYQPIPAQTVTSDTLPTVINITYTATGTAFLAGTNESTYTGKPITLSDLNEGNGDNPIYAGVSGPTGAPYTLQAGDVEFSSDNGQAWTTEMPTNAGTYELRWSEQGKQNIIKEFGNNSIKWVDAQGNSTFTSTATYIINPAPATFTLSNQTSGNYTKIYDAQPTTSIDPSQLTITANFNNAKVVLDTTGLTSDSYEWVDAQGNPISDPKNVGTYSIKLKNSALSTLQKDNPNFTLTNGGGLATYTITQAQASGVLSGSNSRTYDGQATTPAEVNSNGQIGVTVTFPGVTDANKTYILKDGDYEWSSGSAPTNAGSVYHIVLTDAGVAKIQQAVGDNYKISQGTSFGTLVINKAQASAEFSGNPSYTYTGSPNSDYLNGFSIKLNEPNNPTYNLVVGDIEFNVDGTWTTTVPVNVGKYEVRLTQAGWQKVQNAIAGNADYIWNYQGEGNYHIEKVTATITLAGSGSTIYTGISVVIPATDGVVNGINVKLSNGQTYVLKPTDLEFVNDQGNPIPAPTDAGSYKVRLTETVLGQIRNLESNHYNYTYNNDVIDFTIEKANADVTTSGSYDVVYNGQTPEINVDKITNTISTNNGVDLTAPTLSADDYEWVDEGGKVIANPVNVGTYYLKLKDSSQSKIATNNNYTWNFNGLASVTINKANATISFDGSQETTYTGSIVAVNPGNYEVKLSNGQTFQLTDKDIQVIGSPINVGTYQVELSQAGIDAIKAADSNYNYSYDGSQGLLVIVPAKASATISGSQTTQDLELDPSRYTVMVNGQTITGLTTSDFIFSKDGHPAQLTEAGTYDVELSGNAINQLRNENPNYDITFSSTATFTLENSSQTINYVDADGKVISASSVGGKLKGNQVEFTPQFPAGWVASDPSSVPSEITLENEITTIKIKHGITNVDHTNPVPDGEKTVTGSAINGAHENDLNQTITRTIVVTKPDGTKQTIPQAAKIYRNATYDDVTGDVTYGEWSTAKWDAYTPENIPGYTVSESIVPAVEVKNGQQDETVNITYIANEQTGKISYQDAAGKEIGSTTITGKTGETVTITPEIPAGWQLVSGQEIPKTVTVTSNGIPTIIVKVEHGTVVVTPETPATDIPTGKVPGDPSKNYPIMEQLTVTPTRTINIKYPSGEEQLIPQKVTFTRTAIFDEVTGEIKYTEWLPQGTAQWASYQPTTVTGYVPSQKIVPAMTVNPETPNETVDITYDKIPEPQEGQEIISYQDANGQVIHTQTVTGEEDSDVSFKPEVPTNWQPTGDLPHSVKITGGTTVIVIEPVTVPVQEHKTVTRIIVEHLPSGDKQTVQTVVLTGTGTKNLVTGEVTDVKWDHGKFAAFTPATLPGYTTNMRIVPEMDVTAASGDSIVEINYIPNEQTGFIIYRDENGDEITRTALQGKTGEAVAINPVLPAGWELVPGQSIPATVMTTPDGIPDVVILIKHQMITVKPGEKAPTGKVPGNPSTTYEKMESLTKEITRTITVKLSDGQRQIITQTVKFTRTATFDAVTGKATYSAWQVDGSNEWPAYPAPEINGYTASQVSIPAELVIPSDENQSIEIEYTKNNQPVEPDKPVTPITPDQPTTPTNPDQPVTPTQPAQPTEPSVPAKPIAPTNNGDKVMSGNQLPTEPVEQKNNRFQINTLSHTN